MIHLLSVDVRLLESRITVATARIDTNDATPVPAATVATNAAVVHSHTLTHEGVYAHCSTNSRTSQQHSVRGSIQRKPVKAIELQGLHMSHNVQLRLRVLGDQNANHVLIHVRHRSRTSPWVPHVRVLLQTILGLVLRLVDLILISDATLPLAPSDQCRTETTSLFICDVDRVGLVLGRRVQVCLPSVDCTCARTAPLSTPPRVARGDLRTCPPVVGTALSVVVGRWVPTLAVFHHGSLGPNPWLFFSFFTSIWHVFHHRKMSLSLWSLLNELVVNVLPTS